VHGIGCDAGGDDASAAARLLPASSASTSGRDEGICIGSVNFILLNAAIGSDNLCLSDLI